MNEKVQEILAAAGATGGNRVYVDKAYALTEEGEIVAADDANARFVLVGEGGNLPADFAKQYKIKGSDKPAERVAEPVQPFTVQPEAPDGKQVIGTPEASAEKPAGTVPADKAAAKK